MTSPLHRTGMPRAKGALVATPGSGCSVCPSRECTQTKQHFILQNARSRARPLGFRVAQRAHPLPGSGAQASGATATASRSAASESEKVVITAYVTPKDEGPPAWAGMSPRPPSTRREVPLGQSLSTTQNHHWRLDLWKTTTTPLAPTATSARQLTHSLS